MYHIERKIRNDVMYIIKAGMSVTFTTADIDRAMTFDSITEARRFKRSFNLHGWTVAKNDHNGIRKFISINGDPVANFVVNDIYVTVRHFNKKFTSTTVISIIEAMTGKTFHDDCITQEEGMGP